MNFNMNDAQSSMNHDWTREFFPAANGITSGFAVCLRISRIAEGLSPETRLEK